MMRLAVAAAVKKVLGVEAYIRAVKAD